MATAAETAAEARADVPRTGFIDATLIGRSAAWDRGVRRTQIADLAKLRYQVTEHDPEQMLALFDGLAALLLGDFYRDCRDIIRDGAARDEMRQFEVDHGLNPRLDQPQPRLDPLVHYLLQPLPKRDGKPSGGQ